jgi:hypothetical protein
MTAYTRYYMRSRHQPRTTTVTMTTGCNYANAIHNRKPGEPIQLRLTPPPDADHDPHADRRFIITLTESEARQLHNDLAYYLRELARISESAGIL